VDWYHMLHSQEGAGRGWGYVVNMSATTRECHCPSGQSRRHKATSLTEREGCMQDAMTPSPPVPHSQCMRA